MYIPNLCGMSMEIANKILAEAQDIERRRQQKLDPISGPRYPTLKPSPEGKRKPSLTNVFGSREELPPPLPAATRTQSGSDLPPVHRKLRVPTLDDFQLLSVLGKGNFGKVMLAEEKSTKKLYAIKVLKKEFIIQNDEVESTRSEKRVFMTANSYRTGTHPFLVGLHSCFQTESRIYFVMEYINGGDLMLHIQRQLFSPERARFYAIEVLLALEFFHQNNIIYR